MDDEDDDDDAIESEDDEDAEADDGDEAEGEEADREPARARTSPVDESRRRRARRKRQNLRRRYKIQDVIHRRQVLLVQVVKEERGNKGAALTTYLSLAGRYCVLMPNTSHGGGISPQDLQRRRPQAPEVDHVGPEPADDDGLIVRTAGLPAPRPRSSATSIISRACGTKFASARSESTAPALIHRDSDLIKRAIRDIYHREIEEVIVEGEEGYKAARGFMKLLMPSHVRRVKLHIETRPCSSATASRTSCARCTSRSSS